MADEQAEPGAEPHEVRHRKDQPRRDHRREAEGRLDRQVHPADQQDQALADDDDARREICCPTPVRFEVVEERRGLTAGLDDEEHDEHRQQGRAAHEPGGPGPRFSPPGSAGPPRGRFEVWLAHVRRIRDSRWGGPRGA